jgi:hypothetical protein
MALLAARGLARLLALVLTTTLAVAGLVVAVFSVQGDSSTLSLPGLARRARLDDLDARVGAFLAQLQAPGAIAKVAALAGAGAVLLGLLLLFGVLARRRERLVVLRTDGGGMIAARPHALAHAAVALAEEDRRALRAKARITARRRGVGGRLRLTIYHPRSATPADATEAGRARVHPLVESFSLRPRIGGRVPRRGARVG